MKFTRQSAAAALLAVCAAVSCVHAASAAGSDAAAGALGPGAPGGPDGPEGGAPGADEGGPGGGPHHHGFGPSGPGAPGPERPVPGDPLRGLRHLDLSEAQQDKLFAIMHAAAPQQREQMKAERRAHEALRDLGGSPRFDEAKANAAARDLGQAIAAGAVLRARIESEVLAVLSPVQRERLRPQRPPGAPGAEGESEAAHTVRP